MGGSYGMLLIETSLKGANLMRKQLCALLSVALLLSGCGATAGRAGNTVYEAASETMAAMDGNFSVSNSQSALPENRKFIITVSVSAETDNLDAALPELTSAAEECGGYIEDQYLYNGSASSGRRYRSASLTLRIPAGDLDSFTAKVGSLTNVVSSSRSTEDVTLQYVDTESRISVLKTEQTRLMELLAQADNMTDLLEIESRLTEIRADLESYTSQLKVLENQIDYATLSLSLTEVTEYTPVEEKSRLEKIGEGFVNSLKGLGTGILDLGSWILINLPYLAVAALAVFGIRKLLKGKLRKRKAKQEPKKEE